MTPAKVKFKIQRHIKGYNSTIVISGASLEENNETLKEANTIVAASTNPDGVKRPDNDAVVNWKQAVVYSNMAKVARAGFDIAVTNYAELSGDYVGGTKLQQCMDIAGAVAGIGAGFVLAGPAGGIAAITSVALGATAQMVSNVARNRNKDIGNELARERYGMIVRGGGRE